MIRTWVKSGSPWIWLNAAAVSANLLIVLGLLSLIAVRGLGHFWPADIYTFEYQKSEKNSITVIGEIVDTEIVSAARALDSGIKIKNAEKEIKRFLVKTGNRDILGSDFRWLTDARINNRSIEDQMMVVERLEWGNLYGRLISVKTDSGVIEEDDNTWGLLHQKMKNILILRDKIKNIEKHDIGDINYKLERLRLRKKSLQLKNSLDTEALNAINNERDQLNISYKKLQANLAKLYKEIRKDSMTVEVMNNKIVNIPLASVVRVVRPNAMGLLSKTGFYFEKLWEFISDEPREANTEGGILPAIFGTVMMVIIMSIFVTPFGVIAAVYLKEYARQGTVTRIIRVAVNNLAGVPSIVYGVFGLGFFVYFLGGNIDQLFFPEALPAPTFGTPGILWSSLTLALLTVPVVIVATEEGLSRIPRSIREGSLALGATKSETLWRTVLPMASPAMMTGLILAVARAAGEVAPLMLVGVVKLAPSLPLDGNAPFLHLERKFMHLGFHIYDLGFQSPNVEAARPLVFATAFLLVVVIVILNLVSISIRNRLRERYRGME